MTGTRGFIGLGAKGAHTARNILKASYTVIITANPSPFS